MASLLTTNELQKITGGWECMCSRSSGKYMFMSESSCTRKCCVNISVDYYKFGVAYDKRGDMRYCSEDARIAAQEELKEIALRKKLQYSDYDSSDDYVVIV